MRSAAIKSTLLSVLMSAICSAAALAADTASSIARGRALYASVGCYQCHGYVGQGGLAGPRLAPGPMPAQALKIFIRNSVRSMPPYPASILPDADLADIYAYLLSIPPAPRVETIPLLRSLK